MSLLEILQLIGYGTGAAMTLWMCALLARRRSLRAVERLLLLLGASVGLWHLANLILALHAFLGLDQEKWQLALKGLNCLAVIAVTCVYSLLLHAHLYVWANSKHRELNPSEKGRVILSYVPLLFLPLALFQIWQSEFAPIERVFAAVTLPYFKGVSFLTSFSLWAVYVLVVVAVTDMAIARSASSSRERRFLLVLAGSFTAVAFLVALHGVFHVGVQSHLGDYIKTLANLGSLLPTALIAYYIYRYKFLELIVRESLIIATFSVSILVAYLVVVRSLGTWLAVEYGFRRNAVESLLTLCLAIGAVPLRRWLDRRFSRMFQREASLYRDIVAAIGDFKGQNARLADLLEIIETKACEALGLKRVQILPFHQGDYSEDGAGESAGQRHDGQFAQALLSDSRNGVIENSELLSSEGFNLAHLLRRDNDTVGIMLISATDDSLSSEARSVLSVLAAQIAIAIDDSTIIEQNLMLERKVAEGERMAALGQMAATVAHEVKNPLSAIKSIAQVMREDESVSQEYARDLDLIVGETDRLSNSVSQLLNFARTSPVVEAPISAGLLVRQLADVYRRELSLRGIGLDMHADTSGVINGYNASRIRDALSNLLMNAIQATPRGGQIELSLTSSVDCLVFAVEDSGPGIPHHLKEHVWEPFFTTRQRGTGLGLAIVRKRMEEIGGAAAAMQGNQFGGSRFELRVPVDQTSLGC
jgi:signal transduction histidine kinase